MVGPLPCYQKTDRQNGIAQLMQSATESETAREKYGQFVLLALAALFALSPILLDWALHLADTPSARYAALFPVLYWLGVRHEPRERGRKDGYLLLALGVVIVILTVGGGFTRWGRIAVPITLIAMIRLSGLGSTRGALTMLWFVPLPHFVNTLVWPDLVLFYSNAVPDLKLSLEATRVVIQSGEGALRLSQGDAGLALMASLSGVSYFASWQREESLGRTALRMAVAILAALPIRFLSVALALLLLKSGFPHAAQITADGTLWVVTLGWLIVSVPRITWAPPRATESQAPS